MHCGVLRRADKPLAQSVKAPATVSAPAPVAAASRSSEDLDAASDENIQVLGTNHTYTAPAVEVWGQSPVALKDVPQSISVITQQRMEDSNMLTMADAMRQINGILVFPGSTANSNYYSRGYQLTTSIDGTPTTTFLVSHAAQQQDITAPYYGLPLTTANTLWSGSRDANPSQSWGYSNYMTQQTIASITQKLWGDWTATARATFYDQDYNTFYNEPWNKINPTTGKLQYRDQGISKYKGSDTSRSADVYAQGSFKLFNRTHHALFGVQLQFL